MVKKKPADDHEEPVAELKEPKPQPQADYTIGSWSGIPQYRCAKCAFDTLNLNKMLEHLKQHQPIPEPKPRSPILVADKRGNQVITATSPKPEQAPDAAGEGTAEMFEVELEEVSSSVDENGDEHKIFTVKE